MASRCAHHVHLKHGIAVHRWDAGMLRDHTGICDGHHAATHRHSRRHASDDGTGRRIVHGRVRIDARMACGAERRSDRRAGCRTSDHCAARVASDHARHSRRPTRYCLLLVPRQALHLRSVHTAASARCLRPLCCCSRSLCVVAAGGRMGSTDQSISGAFQWFDGAGWTAWYPSTGLPVPVAAGLLMVHNDELYLIGGQTAVGVGSAVVNVFDGSSWTVAFSTSPGNGLPPHWGASGASYGGEMWIAIPTQTATILYRSNNNGGHSLTLHMPPPRSCVCLLSCSPVLLFVLFSHLHSSLQQDDPRFAWTFRCDDAQRLPVAVSGRWCHRWSVH